MCSPGSLNLKLHKQKLSVYEAYNLEGLQLALGLDRFVGLMLSTPCGRPTFGVIEFLT